MFTTICVLVLHVSYAACYQANPARLKEQVDICHKSTSCTMLADDERRVFFVHAVKP